MTIRHPADVLKRLREMLVNDGWLQRFESPACWRGDQGQRDCQPKDDGRGWCPHKAIVWMGAPPETKAEAIKLLASQVGGRTSVDFLRWNDARTTTKADVLATIDAAITAASDNGELRKDT